MSSRHVQRPMIASSSILPCLLVLLCAASGQACAQTESSGTRVATHHTGKNPSRTIGYVLGDVLVQRVAVTEHTAIPDIESLAEPARVGRWLERQSATVVADADGQRWLELRYQVVNVPDRVTLVSLPVITLTDTASPAGKPWSFSLSPLLPAAGSSADASPADDSAVQPAVPALPRLQPDRAPPLRDTTSIRERLMLSVTAFAGVLLVWLGWWLWRNHHDRTTLPFNRAYRLVRQTGRSTANSSAEAWKAVHHAFNQSADATVHPGTVSQLIERQPWLAPERPRIDAFYEASAKRFFQAPNRQPGRQADRPATFELQAFCRDLARAERHAVPVISDSQEH